MLIILCTKSIIIEADFGPNYNIVMEQQSNFPFWFLG